MEHDKTKRQIILTRRERSLLGETDEVLDERLSFFLLAAANRLREVKLIELVELYRESGIEDYSKNTAHTDKLRAELAERELLRQELHTVVDFVTVGYPEVSVNLL